jgi:type I restriction-modification system DNA methylase subunit
VGGQAATAQKGEYGSITKRIWMDSKKEIINIINGMAGKYSGYEIFTDWIRCLALSIEQSTHMIRNKIWQDRERLYLDTVHKYDSEDLEKFGELTARLIEALEEGPDDILGKVYMEAGMGSKIAGQFFTPFHLSELCAEAAIDGQMEKYKAGKIRKITVLEPSCGGGAMILAAAKVLWKNGINYQQAMDVVAQDLDWKGVYMCYVQLSLLGISAICVQGNTLTEPYDPNRTPRSHILTTPRKAGVLI